MPLATPFSLLDNGSSEVFDTRERLYGLANRICNLESIRRTESIEFTDLTTISHRSRTEFSGDHWPERVTGTGAEDPGTGFVFLGFLRRGIPLQHSTVKMYRGGEEYDLPRLRSADTEALAVLLLDAVWLSCAANELGGIPRPLESDRGEPPSGSDDRFNVAPFWQEFLGIRGRSVNPDWDLLKTRFELSESGWANEIWRPPSDWEPKWSYERALLAKLCSKLAFSYIGAAWVPEGAMSASEEPFEIEFEFQERVLREEEQVERVRSLRRRSKKAFERSLRAFRERCARALEDGDRGGLRDQTPSSLDTDLWRLDNVPWTYLGVLDPALDDPDASRQRSNGRRTEPVFDDVSRRFPKRNLAPGIVWLLLAAQRYLRQVLTLAVLGVLGLALWQVPITPDSTIPGTGFPIAPLIPFALWLLVRLSRFLRFQRRETVVLPTWSAGPGSLSYEVSCPPEFIVWQGMLARPSNRGRCWKTRPASELGAKAHLWWSEPDDRGWIEDPPEDRPQLLFLELRARLSPTIALVGSLLAFATAMLLIAPAMANLLGLAVEEASFGDLGADFVATVLLLVPTIGGAILIQPGEDPIARKLLAWDRLLVAASTIVPSVAAVLSILLFGWWWDEHADAGNVLWQAWLGLGSLSLLGSGLLLQAWIQCRGSSVPAPAARQGGIPPWSSPRRRPLDVPAPLRPLKTLKGRLQAERTLLRLAPRRSGRSTPRPTYSLVLPIEGSRIYTPPAPTVLCLIEMPDGEGGNGSGSTAEEIDQFIESVLARLPARDGLIRGVRNTNVIGWQPDTYLSVPTPRNLGADPYEQKLGDATAYPAPLRFFLRLQKANTKPSHLKPVGNGGGLVPLPVMRPPGDSLSGPFPESIEETILNQAKLDDLIPQHTEDSLRRERLEAALRRALVDVDGVLLIPLETVRSCQEFADGLVPSEKGAVLPPALEVRQDGVRSRSLAGFAGCEALRAGTGSGAHVWPSSFEPPLAGESPAWLGRPSFRAALSLRYLFFRTGSGPNPSCLSASNGTGPVGRFVAWLQGFFFDHERRRIPVATLEPVRASRPKSGGTFSDFLLSIPRSFSGVETDDPNARVQRNLWFTEAVARRDSDGRALPVVLETVLAPDANEQPCGGRVVTDVVGDRVWVWSKRLGLDHRNFAFRAVRPSDWETGIPGTDEQAELLTPVWRLASAPAGNQCVGLEPDWASEDGSTTRGRGIVGRLVGSAEVEAVLMGDLPDPAKVRIIARLTPPHEEKLKALLNRQGSAAMPVTFVGDSAGNLKDIAGCPPGNVIVVSKEPGWSGGTVVRPPGLGVPAVKAILVGGLIASGKSDLTQRLRTQMELDDEKDQEYWEVIRNDLRHNLFFQLYDLDQVESMDEKEGLEFSRDPMGSLSQQLARLSQESYLLESIDLLDRAYERAGDYRGGLIIEYWPAFSVKVVAKALVGSSLSSEALGDLEGHLDAWESESPAWKHFLGRAEEKVFAIRLREDLQECRRRAVKRGSGRHNEQVNGVDLERLDEALEAGMPWCPPSEERPDWPLVPEDSYGIVLSGGTLEDLSREIPRIAKLIRGN